jgi:glycosyltransferase involved in cell wall biosynthesis
MKRLLIIAHSFPPRTSSGTRRLIGFARNLPRYGWEPVVLAPDICYYNDKGQEDLNEIPKELKVVRTPAWLPRYDNHLCSKDIARNFVLNKIGRYFMPDRVIGWLPPALSTARRLIRETDCQAIFTSAPRFSVHIIGLAVKRSTGLPWVADFRDPWTANPTFTQRHPVKQAIESRLEAAVIRSADGMSVNSPPLAEYFINQYGISTKKVTCISNGFDQHIIGTIKKSSPQNKNSHLVLTYSGNLGGPCGETYGRMPDAFLRGVKLAIRQEPALAKRLQLQFVGSFPESSRQLVTKLELEDMVHVLGRVSHQQSLEYQCRSNGLLLITGCIPQADRWVIPGKIFEYLGIGRPILALASPESWSWKIINETGTGLVCDTNEAKLARTIIKFCHRIDNGGPGFERNEAVIANYDFQVLTRQLTDFLEQITNARN